MAPSRTWYSLFLVVGISIPALDAFSHRLHVPGRSVAPPTLVGVPKSESWGSWPTGRRRNGRFYRKHDALSVPFSGSPADPKSHSWEEILAPPVTTQNNHLEITVMDKVVLAGFLMASSLALYATMSLTAPGSWRYFAAGGICAATSHTIPTPIDVIKTRKQVDPALSGKSFLQATREIVKNDGMNALWAGVGPTAFGYLLEGAVKFGTYEILKPAFKTLLAGLAASTSLVVFKSQILSFVLCGAAAGVAASIMLCPMEAIRIRMVSEPNFVKGGWLQAGYKILKQEGVVGLCKGINPMIMKQVPYTVTKNVAFDILTKSFYAIMLAQGKKLTAATMFTIPLISAGLSSILSTVTSQPGDMVLSLVNAHKGDRRGSEIFKDIMNSTRGFRGFFVGFHTRLLHVGVTVTIQLLVYDYIKRLCGIAATGTC